MCSNRVNALSYTAPWPSMWYWTRAAWLRVVKELFMRFEPPLSAILSLVSVDVALAGVFSKALSCDYVACCHSDAFGIGFQSSKYVPKNTRRPQQKQCCCRQGTFLCVHCSSFSASFSLNDTAGERTPVSLQQLPPACVVSGLFLTLQE